jgi:hypothetical protein
MFAYIKWTILFHLEKGVCLIQASNISHVAIVIVCDSDVDLVSVLRNKQTTVM